MNVQCLTHQSELKICQTTEIFYTISGWIQLIILFYKINRTYGRKVNCLQNHYWKKIGFQCTFGVKKYVIKLFPRFINACVRGVKAIGPAVHYWTVDCWSSSIQKMLCIYIIFWPGLKIKQNKHYEVLRCSVLWWKWKSESVEGVGGGAVLGCVFCWKCCQDVKSNPEAYVELVSVMAALVHGLLLHFKLMCSCCWLVPCAAVIWFAGRHLTFQDLSCAYFSLCHLLTFAHDLKLW